MDSASKIYNSFNDPEQLKQFCDAQYETILELSQQIEELKQQAESLKAKALISASGLKKNEIVKLDEQDQEIICRTQIALLRERSMQVELTLEEARKLELYSKILGSMKPKQEDDTKDVKDLDSKALLLLVSNGKDD